MQTIPIQAIPSQTFTYIDPSNNTWDIGIRSVASQVAFSITLNGTLLVQNICAVAGYRIIPYDYLENGNFVLITQNFQVPDYIQFGISQNLVFLTQDEIQNFRTPLSSLTTITAADFDPNGGLPLRFSPQGYTIASGYCIEDLGTYITESGNNYITESGGNNYATETNPLYVTENGLGFYFADTGT